MSSILLEIYSAELKQRIEILEIANAQLAFQVESLKEALGANIVYPSILNLTKSETSVLAALYSCNTDYITIDGLLSAYISDNINAVGIGTRFIDKIICTLRKKLSPHGIEISTLWGMGRFMSSQSKSLLKAMIEAEQASK